MKKFDEQLIRNNTKAVCWKYRLLSSKGKRKEIKNGILKVIKKKLKVNDEKANFISRIRLFLSSCPIFSNEFLDLISSLTVRIEATSIIAKGMIQASVSSA